MTTITGETLLNNLTELFNYLRSIQSFKTFTVKRKVKECNTVISLLEKLNIDNIKGFSTGRKKLNLLDSRLNYNLECTSSVRDILKYSAETLEFGSCRKLLRIARSEAVSILEEATRIIEAFIEDIVCLNSLRLANSGLLLFQ